MVQIDHNFKVPSQATIIQKGLFCPKNIKIQ